jgi:hypothetical protein
MFRKVDKTINDEVRPKWLPISRLSGVGDAASGAQLWATHWLDRRGLGRGFEPTDLTYASDRHRNA